MTDVVVVLSLNEVESLAAKATRGAGFEWGAAEDVGRASRWLAARDRAWAEPLFRLFAHESARKALHHALAAADRVRGAGAGEAWISAPVAPVWLLPVLAAAIHGRDIALSLDWGADTIVLHADGIVSTTAERLDLADLPLAPVAIKVMSAADTTLPLDHEIGATTRRSALAKTFLRELDAFATRTYVPASEASRTLGAGGARLDGD